MQKLFFHYIQLIFGLTAQPPIHSTALGKRVQNEVKTNTDVDANRAADGHQIRARVFNALDLMESNVYGS